MEWSGELVFRVECSEAVKPVARFKFASMSWLIDDIWTTATRSDRSKAEQVNRLEKLLELTRTEEPDLEYERLFQEGDAKGLLDYLRRQRDTGS